MPHGLDVVSDPGEPDRGIGDGTSVMIGDPLTSPLKLRQVPELHAEQRGLEFVQAGIDPLDFVNVLLDAAVVSQEADALGNLIGIRDHGFGVSEGPQILGREKAEAADGPPGPRHPSRHRGSVTLSAVLDDEELIFFSHGMDGGHVTGLAVQVDRHDGPGAFRDSWLDSQGIEIVKFVGLHENRGGAALRDAQDGGDIGIRRDDDLIPRADVEGAHREDERVQSRGQAHAVPAPREIGRAHV